MLYIIPATARHARRLAPILRQADKDEIAALTAESPVTALASSFVASDEAYTVMLDGLPVGMFGVVETEPGVGMVWLVGSDLMTGRVAEFARGSIEFAQRLFRRFDYVTNIVDVRNTVHMRWLCWLGAEFLDTVCVGPEQRPFRRFIYVHRRSPDCSRSG